MQIRQLIILALAISVCSCKKTTERSQLPPTTHETQTTPRENSPITLLSNLNKRNEIFYPINSEIAFTGIVISNYPNGQNKTRFPLKNGLINGTYEEWHPNGQLNIKCSYKDGKKEGLYKTWSTSGQILENSMYSNGLLNGPSEIFSDNQLTESKQYNEGKLDGLHKKISGGKIREAIHYSNDRIKSIEKFYPTGVTSSLLTTEDGIKSFFTPEGSRILTPLDKIPLGKSIIFEVRYDSLLSTPTKWRITFKDDGGITLRDESLSLESESTGKWSVSKPDTIYISLINFHGLGHPDPFTKRPVETIRANININENGAFTLSNIYMENKKIYFTDPIMLVR